MDVRTRWKRLWAAGVWCATCFSIVTGWINASAETVATHDSLAGTSWTLKVTPLSTDGPTAAFTDTLQFESGEVSSSRLSAEGYPSATFTVSTGDEGISTWESTFMIRAFGSISSAFWKGHVRGDTMIGRFGKHPSYGAHEYFTFVGKRMSDTRATALTDHQESSLMHVPPSPVQQPCFASQIEDMVAGLREKWAAREAALASTQKTLQQLQAEANAQAQAHVALTEELTQHRQLLEERQRQLTVSEERLTHSQDTIAQLEGAQQQLQAKLDRQKEQLRVSQETLATTTETLETTQEALHTLQRANATLTKEAADLYYTLGVLFSKDKQYPQAAAAFHKVIELRPDDGEAHHNLGVIYAEYLPDLEKALEHFHRYLETNPRGPEANRVTHYISSWQDLETVEGVE